RLEWRLRSPCRLRVVADGTYGRARRLRNLSRRRHVRGELVALLQPSVLHGVCLLPDRDIVDHTGESVRRIEWTDAAGRIEHREPGFQTVVHAALEFEHPA